jgi:hypothetical protein
MIHFDFVITQPDESRPAVALEFKNIEEVTQELDEGMRARLWSAQIHHGILITRGKTRVYEDIFQRNDPSTYRCVDIDTIELIPKFGQALEEERSQSRLESLIRDWIDLLVNDWSIAIPRNLIRKLHGLIPVVANGLVRQETEVEEAIG